MSSPEPASSGRRRSWPLFTRAATPDGTEAPAQPVSRAVKLVVVSLCAFLLLAPLSMLLLGAPPAPTQHSADFWARGPQYIVGAARQSFFGNYLPKPRRSATTLPYPVEDGLYASTSPSSSLSIAQIDDFPPHRQASRSSRLSTSLQTFFHQVPQQAHVAGQSLLALPASVGHYLGLTRRSSWSDSLVAAPQRIFRAATDKLGWGRPAGQQGSIRNWYNSSNSRLESWSRSVSRSTSQSWHTASKMVSAFAYRAAHPSSWFGQRPSFGKTFSTAYRQVKSQGQKGLAVCSSWLSAGRSQMAHAYRLTVQTAKTLLRKQREMVVAFWDLVGPGGKLHPEDFIEYHGDVLIQLLLLAVCLYLLFQRRTRPASKKDVELTQQEIQQFCAEWEPEPLVEPHTAMDIKEITIVKRNGPFVTVAGDDKRSKLNMVSNDFLGLSQNAAIQKRCTETINKYGVGSCGPRAFYGTIDVHLEVEARLAAFMGTEECILYSYDMATAPSVIPAFANAKDIIVADEAVNYAVQNGCTLSRAKIHYFKHNDMQDLERLLAEIDIQERKKKKPLNRRFIATEGVFASTGDLAPLKAIHSLKTRFKYRMIVDESFAFGLLGDNGRGACELAGLQPEDVEIVCSSLGNAMGSVGGMCVGNRDVVDHQRLSGLGYCFSASLPPFLATATTAALDQLWPDDSSKQTSSLQEQLLRNAAQLRQLLSEVPGLNILGAAEPAVPLLHLLLAEPPPTNGRTETQVLQQIADQCLENGALITVHQISPLDHWQQRPTLRLTVSAVHEKHDVEKAVECLRAAVQQVLSCKPPTPPPAPRTSSSRNR